MKLYDNDKLTVFDAALAYGLSNEDVFPKRGQDLTYTLNGKQRFVRGELRFDFGGILWIKLKKQENF